MFLYRKNIILVPTDFDGISWTKGLVSFDCHSTKTECGFRSYNLDFDKNLVLGILINNKLHKVEINPKDFKNYSFDLNQTINNNDNISCVLINLKQNGYDIVLWGSSQMNEAWKTSLSLMLDDEFLEKRQEDLKNKNTQTETMDKNKQFEEQFDFEKVNQSFLNFEDDKEIDDKRIDLENLKICDNQNEQNEKFCNFDQINDENLQKNAEFSQNFKNSQIDDGKKDNSKFESTNKIVAETDNVLRDEKTEVYSFEDEKINAFIDKVIDMTEHQNNLKNNLEDLSFYERINYQIEKMFVENRAEPVLNEILPNSKFCRVDFEDDSGYYVFGIIYDNNIPKYLCYGLPAKYGDTPPKELTNLYQWLPIDTQNEFGDGYYMMYQDAITGKNISVEII